MLHNLSSALQPYYLYIYIHLYSVEPKRLRIHLSFCRPHARDESAEDVAVPPPLRNRQLDFICDSTGRVPRSDSTLRDAAAWSALRPFVSKAIVTIQLELYSRIP